MLQIRPVIDLAILTRTADDLHPQVAAAIQAQQHVQLRIHRIVGTPRPSDRSRIETIVRARNEAARRAQGEWLMFLDDDVVLGHDTIARLHHALTCRPQFGAFAADYLGDCGHRRPSQHIAMGATMFRTAFLSKNPFRCEQGKCECLCRCLDMRDAGQRIEYLEHATAFHLAKSDQQHPKSSAQRGDTGAVHSERRGKPQISRSDAKVLTAFDRRDVRSFRNVFLRSLRASGNEQEVIVVGYGLTPSESRTLSHLHKVSVIRKPFNGLSTPIRRLRDFGEISAELPAQTPVAYWDAADVIFQGRLDSLWDLTQSHPDRILAVKEPVGYPQNPAAEAWCSSIFSPEKRRRALQLVSSNPFLNSGFGAGTAAAMGSYFKTANRIRHSSDMQGSTDWGDQLAMNLYCHQNPDRWQQVPETWNFCTLDRPAGTVRISGDGIVSCAGTTPVCVHGNGKSLRQLALRS